jgi:hypothetical protein
VVEHVYSAVAIGGELNRDAIPLVKHCVRIDFPDAPGRGINEQFRISNTKMMPGRRRRRVPGDFFQIEISGLDG